MEDLGGGLEGVSGLAGEQSEHRKILLQREREKYGSVHCVVAVDKMSCQGGR